MSRASLSLKIGVTASALALSFVPALAANAAGVNYVALGDSYASGVGSGSYLSSSGSCDRSPNAYPALWAAAHHPKSYSSVACSGAKTTDVIANQLSALSRRTNLVSITVGGNDEGFSGIMEDCVIFGTTTCVDEIDAAEADASANLPGKLANVYDAIKGKAPNAHVVVLGYPDFYDLANDCVGISQTSRTAIDAGIDLLDSIIRSAAQHAGFTYAEVRGSFTGHEICDNNSWLHSLDWWDIGDSYHPTADGQKYGYLPVFSGKA